MVSRFPRQDIPHHMSSDAMVPLSSSAAFTSRAACCTRKTSTDPSHLKGSLKGPERALAASLTPDLRGTGHTTVHVSVAYRAWTVMVIVPGGLQQAILFALKSFLCFGCAKFDLSRFVLILPGCSEVPRSCGTMAHSSRHCSCAKWPDDMAMRVAAVSSLDAPKLPQHSSARGCGIYGHELKCDRTRGWSKGGIFVRSKPLPCLEGILPAKRGSCSTRPRKPKSASVSLSHSCLRLAFYRTNMSDRHLLSHDPAPSPGADNVT